MGKLFLADWKCCALQLIAVSLTIATMILTASENQAYPYILSFVAIVFIGLSMRRTERLKAFIEN